MTELLEKVECQVFPANLLIHRMVHVFPNTVTKEWFVTGRGSYANLLGRGLIRSSVKSKEIGCNHVWRTFAGFDDDDGIPTVEERHCRLCGVYDLWKRPWVKNVNEL